MVDSVLFIGTIIIALTQVVKILAPKVSGLLTIIVAALIGGLIGLIDIYIGVGDISVAQGILTGLGASGVVYTAGRINTSVK